MAGRWPVSSIFYGPDIGEHTEAFIPHGKNPRKGGFSIPEEQTLPAPDTMACRLLALTAISGELPANLLPKIPGGERYKELTVLSLKEKGLLHTYYRDHLRGYRLGRQAKALLLAQQPGRFSFFLTGSRDTNLLKSEAVRRLRLHHIAAMTVLAQNAGVRVFRDGKPDLFAPDGFDPAHFSKTDLPLFYTSREVKAVGPDAIKIRGSRMTGVLLAFSGIYLTYHGGHAPPKWEAWAEEKAKTLMQILLCRERLAGFYRTGDIRALLVCEGMEPLAEILSSADTPERCFYLLDDNHSQFIYLTNDLAGEKLLRLLCSPDKQAGIDRLLRAELRPPIPKAAIEHDALDAQGRPVLFAYLPNIPRLGRFLEALKVFDRPGCIACFDFQARTLQGRLGPGVSFLPISLEKAERAVSL